MNKHLVCIKIGGSVITDKSKPFTAKPHALRQFANDLKAVWEQYHATTDFLVGNGVGSFGHFSAHEYKLQEGAHTPEQYYGMSLTHNHVRRFNTVVAELLLKEELPVFAVSPGDFLTLRDKVLATHTMGVIKGLLKRGCIPLLHGDTLLDQEHGVSIYSTEQSLFWCAEQVREEYESITVIEIVDTGGVLDETGAVMSELPRGKAITLYSEHAHDVTGGIIGKVESARQATAWASGVYLIGNEPGSLQAILSGEPRGTHIL